MAQPKTIRRKFYTLTFCSAEEYNEGMDQVRIDLKADEGDHSPAIWLSDKWLIIEADDSVRCGGQVGWRLEFLPVLVEALPAALKMLKEFADRPEPKGDTDA